MSGWLRMAWRTVAGGAAALALVLSAVAGGAVAPASVPGAVMVLSRLHRGAGEGARETLTPALRVVSYNIRHGRGMDDEVDLPRTARVLESLAPDVVALQEVDDRAERSGGVPQAQELGLLLDLHWAFGKFMDFQGGGYGMATLSRHPMVRQEALQLPIEASPDPRSGMSPCWTSFLRPDPRCETPQSCHVGNAPASLGGLRVKHAPKLTANNRL